MTDDSTPIPIDPAADRELAGVEARLRRGMAIQPPDDLAMRVFDASRPALRAATGSDPDSRTERVDPFIRYGPLVSAAAMLLFGAGLMLHVLWPPAPEPTGSAGELETLASAAAEPVYIPLDAELRRLEQQVDSMDLALADDEAMLLPDERSLAYDLARLESERF